MYNQNLKSKSGKKTPSRLQNCGVCGNADWKKHLLEGNDKIPCSYFGKTVDYSMRCPHWISVVEKMMQRRAKGQMELF